MKRKEWHKLNCVVCWTEFVWYSTTNKYCSKKCSKESERIKNMTYREKQCFLCWEVFMWTAKQRYCSWCLKKIPKLSWEKMSKEQKEKQRQIAKRARQIQQQQFDAQSEEEKEKRKKKHWEIFKKRRDGLTEEQRNNVQEKAHKTLKMNASKRKKEKWYAWTFERPWASAYARKFYTKNSKVNLKRKKEFEKYWYKISSEFNLWDYRYDFKIWNTLIEINPRAFHNSNIQVKSDYKLKDKEYHYNKLKFAIDSWYNCIMVWPWMTLKDALALIKENKKVSQSEIVTHWFNIKTKEHLVWDNYNEEEMRANWYTKIYDWWEKYL